MHRVRYSGRSPDRPTVCPPREASRSVQLSALRLFLVLVILIFLNLGRTQSSVPIGKRPCLPSLTLARRPLKILFPLASPLSHDPPLIGRLVPPLFEMRGFNFFLARFLLEDRASARRPAWRAGGFLPISYPLRVGPDFLIRHSFSFSVSGDKKLALSWPRMQSLRKILYRVSPAFR